MNKYRDKSDFEINKAVAININGTDAVVEKFGITYIVDEDMRAMVSFAPCNNPEDAMPIIIENGIGLLPYKKSPPLAFDLKKGLGFGILVENENIYRAAMEVFLMMKEAENES